MNEPENGVQSSHQNSINGGDLLDSWKEIASYLRRSVRTVKRWETAEGLPVRRHQHNKQATVYALRSEVDAWLEKRGPAPEPNGLRARWGSLERTRAGMALGAALLLIGALVWMKPTLPSPQAQLSGGQVSADAREKRLVVLPFHNLGPGETDHIADGISNEIRNRVSSIHGLGIIGRTTSRHYGQGDHTLRHIAEALRVDYILSGTVLWNAPSAGEMRVRVSPELIRTADGIQIWTSAYEDAGSEIFTLQKRIAEQVAVQVDSRLLAFERSVGASRLNTEAYDHYLRATRGSGFHIYLPKKLQHLQDALRLEPEFVEAQAALAGTLIGQELDWPSLETEEALRAAIVRAGQLDPRSPEVLYARANYYWRIDGDLGRALETFEEIRKVRPSFAPDDVGSLYRDRGEWDKALQSYRRTLDLDPLSTPAALGMHFVYRLNRHFEEAQLWLERWGAIRRELGMRPQPSKEALLRFVCQGDLEQLKETHGNGGGQEAWVLTHNNGLLRYTGDYETMVQRLTRNSKGEHSSASHYRLNSLNLARAYRMGDRVEESRRHAQKAVDYLEERVRVSKQDYLNNHVRRAELGRAYALLGHKEEAIRHGERAAREYPPARDALRGPRILFILADIYALVGEEEKAIDLLDHLLSIPSEMTVHTLRHDHAFKSLWGHPKFRTLLKRHGGELPRPHLSGVLETPTRQISDKSAAG